MPTNNPIPLNGFTLRHNGIANILRNEITISEAYDPKSGLPQPTSKQYVGIWDTGASGTVINSKIITELNLKPTGKVNCQAVGSGGKVNTYLANTYSINVILPNKVRIIGVVASEGEIGGGDILIGMNIICLGDFAITNLNGKTTLSFQTPSIKEIDFVKEIASHKAKIPRNDPCPCGSGKKYKICHGK